MTAAIVTGASGALGSVLVRTLRDAGYAVAGIYHSNPPAGLGGEQADVTRAADVQAAVTRILTRHDKVGALINVAGGFAGGQAVQETDEVTWDHMMALNLKSAYLWSKAVLPHMLAAGNGRIVNVSSRAAVQAPPKLSAYNVSKLGVISLTETLAAELRGTGVTANVILPSVIDTQANRASMPATSAPMVGPEAIAAVVLDLLSDRWGIVSGASIPVYGDA